MLTASGISWMSPVVFEVLYRREKRQGESGERGESGGRGKSWERGESGYSERMQGMAIQVLKDLGQLGLRIR